MLAVRVLTKAVSGVKFVLQCSVTVFKCAIIQKLRGRCRPGSALFRRTVTRGKRETDQEQPLVLPQVVHFMQVPLRTSVKLPHSPQASPS